MKSVSVIKSISIFLLVLLAFVQFTIIISENYSGFSNILDKGYKEPQSGKDMFSYDYVSIESIRISDGENNYWDLARKSDEYYQIKLAANEILKQSAASSVQPLFKSTWDELVSGKYIMVQYFCEIPMSFVSSFSGSTRSSLERIYKLMIYPAGTNLEFYLFDGSSYYRLDFDATQDHYLNSIDYESIFNFVRYSNFYDESTYKLLGLSPTAYQLQGRYDTKLYMGQSQAYHLVINTTPSLISDISSLEDTYDLKDLKKRFFGVIQDRYTSSLSSNKTVFFSNMENQYAISHDGKITFDYFGKQNLPDRGDVDMAYNKTLNMMQRVMSLMVEKTATTLVLTDIDYSNPKYYTFYFDYMTDGGKLVYINQDPLSMEVQHAFSVQAHQNNVLKLSGMLRTIIIDKEYTNHYENNTVKMLTDQTSFISDHFINNIYNGYILFAGPKSSILTVASIIDCEDRIFGIPLPIVQYNPNSEAMYELE